MIKSMAKNEEQRRGERRKSVAVSVTEENGRCALALENRLRKGELPFAGRGKKAPCSSAKVAHSWGGGEERKRKRP